VSLPLHYTKSHEWIRVDGKIGYIGISDHAQKEVTDVVYVEMAKVGKALKAGEEATTLESVKAAFSITPRSPARCPKSITRWKRSRPH